jgi:ABC-type molybdate transport system ATPase subunit
MKNIFEARFDDGAARAGALTFSLIGPVDPVWRFMAVRPEDVRVHGASPEAADGASNLFPGRVTRIDHQGVFVDVRVRCSGLLWQILLPTSRLLDEAIAEGGEVWLEVPAEKIHAM